MIARPFLARINCTDSPLLRAALCATRFKETARLDAKVTAHLGRDGRDTPMEELRCAAQPLRRMKQWTYLTRVVRRTHPPICGRLQSATACRAIVTDQNSNVKGER